jgi:hypothetical protein
MKWKTESVLIWALIFLRLAFSWWVYGNATNSEIFEIAAVVTGVLDGIGIIFILVSLLSSAFDAEFPTVRSVLFFSGVPSLFLLIGYLIVFRKKIDQKKDPITIFFAVDKRSQELRNRFTKEQIKIILWVEQWAKIEYATNFKRAVENDYFIAAGGLILLKTLGDIKGLHLKTEDGYSSKVFVSIKKTRRLLDSIQNKIEFMREEESKKEKDLYYDIHVRRAQIISDLVEEGIKDVEFLHGVTKN